MQALVSLTNSLYVTGNSILNQLAISGKCACNEVIVTSGGVYIKTKTLFSYKDTFYDRHLVFVEWIHNLGSHLMKGIISPS